MYVHFCLFICTFSYCILHVALELQWDDKGDTSENRLCDGPNKAQVNKLTWDKVILLKLS